MQSAVIIKHIKTLEAEIMEWSVRIETSTLSTYYHIAVTPCGPLTTEDARHCPETRDGRPEPSRPLLV